MRRFATLVLVTALGSAAALAAGPAEAARGGVPSHVQAAPATQQVHYDRHWEERRAMHAQARSAAARREAWRQERERAERRARHHSGHHHPAHRRPL